MTSPAKPVTVTVVAVTSAPCSGKMTWEMAANWLQERLDRRFGSQVRFQYVELFSPESFAFPDVMEAIQQGTHQLPIVLVDGEIVLSGSRLNEGLITRHVRDQLQKAH
ncbi:MAG TPA: DUF1462 family protein [Terriglobia bacterium]|nr:DUF1462 family protein [Terriglobia bacterium]